LAIFLTKNQLIEDVAAELIGILKAGCSTGQLLRVAKQAVSKDPVACFAGLRHAGFGFAGSFAAAIFVAQKLRIAFPPNFLMTLSLPVRADRLRQVFLLEGSSTPLLSGAHSLHFFKKARGF
jgi:hypothetical protein